MTWPVRDSQGVNMVELTIMALFISILAAIGMFQQSRGMEKAAAGDAMTYLGMLRSAELRYRANNPAGAYTNLLSQLDAELPSLGGRWSAPSLSAPAATGLATLARSRGVNQDQTLGITYGTATLCGTFEPLQPLPTCTPD